MPFTLFKKFPHPTVEPAALGTVVAKPATAPEPSNNAAQNLGSLLAGKIDIRCKLEGVRSVKWAPKWCILPSDSFLQGVLYFELQFTRPRDIPLEYAKVRIKLGRPANGDPLPTVDAYEPSNGISGPPIAHTTAKHHSLNPQLGITTPVGGANASAGEWGGNEGSNPYRSWEFSSGTPSSGCGSTDVTDVEFTWTAGWEDDYDALNRKFRTAVVIMRDKPERIAMSVQVEAKTLKGWTAGPPQEKKSGWLEPKNNTDETEFNKLRDNLETDIKDAIVEMTPMALRPRWAANTDQTSISPHQLSGIPNAGLLEASGTVTPASLAGSAVLLLPPTALASSAQLPQTVTSTVTA